MNLSELKHGDDALITGVDGTGPIAQRLLELGFAPGAGVRVVSQAPFKGPLMVEVGQSMYGVRVSEATAVTVEPGAFCGRVGQVIPFKDWRSDKCPECGGKHR
jgi:ferrous iron transport protein A